MQEVKQFIDWLICTECLKKVGIVSEKEQNYDVRCDACDAFMTYMHTEEY